MTRCCTCYWWKRRHGIAGMCWQHHATVLEDDTCAQHEARVVFIPMKVKP